MIITPLLFNNTAVEESPDGEGEVPTILLRSWSAQSVRSQIVSCACDDRTFPALFEEKEPSFQKKMKRRLLLSEIGETNAILLFLLRQKGLFDFSFLFFSFWTERFSSTIPLSRTLSLFYSSQNSSQNV